PVPEFFSQFSSSFTYTPENSSSAEFYRLCDELGWEKNEPQRTQAHKEFKNALTRQFNTNYGTEKNSLESWQALCKHLGANPVPKTLNRCRQMVMTTHVNLVDLVDVFESDKVATVFDTVEELSRYTMATGKYFPREDIDAGDLLKHLLRPILNPSM
ncbi:hypothetical protein BDN70DRAFT_767230, partial [Pholiota conissans]